MVARGSSNEASTSASPALHGSTGNRGGQPSGNSLNAAAATAAAAAQSDGAAEGDAQASGGAAIADNTWTTIAGGSGVRVRARPNTSRAITSAAAGNGHNLNNNLPAGGPLPSGAAPAVGTIPEVGHTAFITVQCPNNEHYTVEIDLRNAVPFSTYNININIPPCLPGSPGSPGSPSSPGPPPSSPR